MSDDLPSTRGKKGQGFQVGNMFFGVDEFRAWVRQYQVDNDFAEWVNVSASGMGGTFYGPIIGGRTPADRGSVRQT